VLNWEPDQRKIFSSTGIHEGYCLMYADQCSSGSATPRFSCQHSVRVSAHDKIRQRRGQADNQKLDHTQAPTHVSGPARVMDTVGLGTQPLRSAIPPFLSTDTRNRFPKGGRQFDELDEVCSTNSIIIPCVCQAEETAAKRTRHILMAGKDLDGENDHRYSINTG
jgi:hypothetical protein